jgi:hypothetical protein
MKANADKYQTLVIGNKTHAKKITFILKENLIECEDEAKLLVVTIDYRILGNSAVFGIPIGIFILFDLN